MFDSFGEKHIADVKTKNDLVIEFQHSPIRSVERQARECFYKNMLWVVDGTRQKHARRRFAEGQPLLQPTNQAGIYFCRFAEETFPKNWLDSSVPVLFDFASEIEQSSYPPHYFQPLWCLLPEHAQGRRIVLAVSRHDLVKRALSMRYPIHWTGIEENIEKPLDRQRVLLTALSKPSVRPQVWWPRRNSRRL